MSHDGTKDRPSVFNGLAVRFREILTVGDGLAGLVTRSGALRRTAIVNRRAAGRKK
jgi:hypothetical protein